VPGPFDAEPATIKDLLIQENQGFYVPIYQREYEWGKDEIDRLFGDVAEGIGRASQESADATFLGTVILVAGRQTVQGNDRRAIPSQVLTIVDGQQRITTLVFIMAAILVEVEALQLTVNRELPEGSAKNWILSLLQRTRSRVSRTLYIESDEDAAEPWSTRPRIIRQEIDSWGFSEAAARYDSDVAWLAFKMITYHSSNGVWALPDMDERPSLSKPFSAIRANVRKVVDGQTDVSYLDDMTQLRASQLCDSVFGEKVPEDIDDDAYTCVRESLRVAMFAGFARDHVLVIDVRARDENLAFALFEPLNATGLPLTALETFKPLVVHSEGPTNYSASPSAASLGAVEGMLNSLTPSRDRIRLTSELLTAFALAQTGEKLGYSLFEQRMWLHKAYIRSRENGSSLANRRRFVAELRHTAEFLLGPWHRYQQQLCHLTELELSEEDRLNLLVLSDSRHVVAAPLLGLYWDKARSTGEAEDFRACLRAIAAFWVLWRTSRAQTAGIDTHYRRIMQRGISLSTGIQTEPFARMLRTGDLPIVSELQETLRNLLADRGRVGSLDAWVDRMNAQPIYQTSRALARYILLVAHRDTRPGKNHEERGLPVPSGVTGTLDTMRPDVWRALLSVEHMAPQSPQANDPSYDPELFTKGMVDRIGNLTILPEPLNSFIGNRPWTFKKSVFKAISIDNLESRKSELQRLLPSASESEMARIFGQPFLPIVQSVGETEGDVLTASYVERRGRKVGTLAYKTLSGWLGYPT
jgi:hypothetical protein